MTTREDEGMAITEFVLARVAEIEQGADDWRTLDRQHFDRVLEMCTAMRRAVELHGPSTDHGGRFDPFCVGCWEASNKTIARPYPCRTLRRLASMGVDHPDYDEAWRRDTA